MNYFLLLPCKYTYCIILSSMYGYSEKWNQTQKEKNTNQLLCNIYGKGFIYLNRLSKLPNSKLSCYFTVLLFILRHFKDCITKHFIIKYIRTYYKEYPLLQWFGWSETRVRGYLACILFILKYKAALDRIFKYTIQFP